MAQINIQLDEITLKALQVMAAREHTSISKWVEDRIHHGLKQEWPENYFSIFGVLDEDDLLEPPEIPFKYETNREKL